MGQTLMIALNVIHLIFVFLNHHNLIILAFVKITFMKKKKFINVNYAIHLGFNLKTQKIIKYLLAISVMEEKKIIVLNAQVVIIDIK